ncbi:MAG: hypothetical protein ACYCSQ_05255 [bacterium]
MAKIFKDIGTTQKRVNPELIANALGAEETGIRINTKQGPASLFSLRQFLVGRLKSTGGRPRIIGTRKVQSKISYFEEDLKKLTEIAEYYKKKDKINVTSSQIASALIHAELSKISESELHM